jgi:ribosomal-protein-alanine N-acetyltransferase
MELESERLIFLEINWNDLEDFHTFSCIPEIREYSTIRIPEDISETRELLNSIIEEQRKNPRKSYEWKVIFKVTNTFLGLAGLKLSLDKFRLGEIYYEVHPSQWVKG